VGTAKKSGTAKLSMAEKEAMRQKRVKKYDGVRSAGRGANNRTRSEWGNPGRKDSKHG